MPTPSARAGSCNLSVPRAQLCHQPSNPRNIREDTAPPSPGTAQVPTSDSGCLTLALLDQRILVARVVPDDVASVGVRRACA